MQRQINDNEEKASGQEDSLNKVKIDNIKLLTDMKIMREEHIGMS